MKPYLAKKLMTETVLRKYNLKAKKSYGQNFLINENIVSDIIDKSGITKEDTVLEIGPGIGTMTQYLSEASKQVIAVEIDKGLLPVLEDTLQGFNNVTVINNDILKVDLKAFKSEFCPENNFVVVANLPYYITTPIIMKLLEDSEEIDSITVMVQSEVADRINAEPGGKDYGAITLAVNYYATVEKLLDVSPNSFMPAPHVDSTVIKLTKKQEKDVIPDDEKLMFKIIRASFNQRRKTLVNGIKNDPTLPFSREDVEVVLSDMGMDTRIRGERLSLTEFCELSNRLSKRLQCQ